MKRIYVVWIDGLGTALELRNQGSFGFGCERRGGSPLRQRIVDAISEFDNHRCARAAGEVLSRA
jgi:hypothetical protein